MGKGLALQFREAYPDNYKQYKEECDKGFIEPGWMYTTRQRVWNDKDKVWEEKFIINFPTKYHWRNKSQLDWIDSGLCDLKNTIENYNIKTLALPMVGCGLGGLDRQDVIKLIEKRLSNVECIVTVYGSGWESGKY